MMNNVYQYYNRRPDGGHYEDCVCRAISTATGLKYETVEELLDMTSEYYSCDKLYVGCYSNLLSKVFKYDKFYCKEPITVGELVGAYKDKRLIIRVQGHLTSSIFGTLLDIWDCESEYVDCFWVVE